MERNPTPTEADAIHALYRGMTTSVRQLDAASKNALRRSIMEKYAMGWTVPMIAEKYGMRVGKVMDIISSFGTQRP